MLLLLLMMLFEVVANAIGGVNCGNWAALGDSKGVREKFSLADEGGLNIVLSLPNAPSMLFAVG